MRRLALLGALLIAAGALAGCNLTLQPVNLDQLPSSNRNL